MLIPHHNFGVLMRPHLSFAVLTGLVLMAATSFGQAVLPEGGQRTSLDHNVFGLGLFGGPATGVGLSFRHHLASPVSYQITGGIIKISDKLSYDIGGEVQYDLARPTGNRFFVMGGLGYYYAGKDDGNEMSGPARLGLGLGGEFGTSTAFNVTVEAVFTYFTDGTVLPLPQLGFHYYFY
jgi:hypothetical protein